MGVRLSVGMFCLPTNWLDVQADENCISGGQCNSWKSVYEDLAQYRGLVAHVGGGSVLLNHCLVANNTLMKVVLQRARP